MPLLERFGFDNKRLVFAFKTTIVAFMALVVAQALGLEHPQRSAMTVWATAQHMREHLLEKGLWRFLGTISGIIVGVALIFTAQWQPWTLVLGLALWVGLCSGIGLLQRGMVAYGTVLAGYSAAMVALLSSAQPEHVLLLGLDRFLTIAVGVVLTMGLGYFFTPKRPAHTLSDALRATSAACLHDVLAQAQSPASVHSTDLLQKIALLDEGMDMHAIGSLKSRQRVQQARLVLLAQLNLALYLQHHPQLNLTEDLQAAIAARAQAMPSATEFTTLSTPPQTDAATAELVSLINALLLALNPSSQTTRTHANTHLRLHSNWLGAAHTLVRSFSVLGAVGLLWLYTGWSFLPFMMLGLSVMLSIFASFENPAWFMRYVTLGQVMGAGAALVCMWLVWPLAHSSWQMVWWMLPFMVSCVFIYAHKRSMLASFDCIMVMLILLQPSFPIHIGFAQSVGNAVSVVMGPVIALLAYRFIFPAHPSKRLQHLLTMVRYETRSLCAPHLQADQVLAKRTRLIHSLLRAQRLNDKHAQSNPDIAADILKQLAKIELIVGLQQSLQDSTQVSSSTRRLMRAVLKTWQSPEHDAQQATHMLQVLQQRLPTFTLLHLMFNTAQ